jgi:hypothetical protein
MISSLRRYTDKIKEVCSKFNDDLTLFGITMISLIAFNFYWIFSNTYFFYTFFLPLNAIIHLNNCWFKTGFCESFFNSIFSQKKIKFNYFKLRLLSLLMLLIMSASVGIQLFNTPETNKNLFIQTALFLSLLGVFITILMFSNKIKLILDNANTLYNELSSKHSFNSSELMEVTVTNAHEKTVEVTSRIKSYDDLNYENTYTVN